MGIGTANMLLFILLCAYCVIDFLEIAYEILSGNLVGIDTSIWLRVAAEVAVVVLLFVWGSPGALGFRAPRPGNLFYSVMLAFFIYLPLSVLLDFIVYIFSSTGASIPEHSINEAVTSMPFIIEFLYFCVLAPFAEELIFRGALQGAYERKIGFGAFVISGILFGVMHADPLSSLNGAIVGVLFGYVYLKTRSIWCPIAMHLFYNLFAFTALPDIFLIRLPWVLGAFPVETMTFANTGYAVYSVGVAALGVLMCYILIRLLQKENPGNAAKKAPDYRPQPAQWAIVACVCVLLAVRVLAASIGYFL